LPDLFRLAHTTYNTCAGLSRPGGEVCQFGMTGVWVFVSRHREFPVAGIEGSAGWTPFIPHILPVVKHNIYHRSRV